MGGIGSGTGIRPNRKRTKQFVEAFPSIDASAFPCSFMRLLPRKACQLSIQGVTFQIYPDKLLILQANQPETLLYEIFFSLTPTHYGNHRYWLQCPKCNHRRCKLSLIRMDGYPLFLCRCCLNLVYQSQNRTQGDQIIHKKWAFIQKLGWHSECIPDEAKPKGMHWGTFIRLRNEIEFLHDEAFRFSPMQNIALESKSLNM